MQLALVVACLLSTGALLSLQVGRPWHLAWWDYHVFLLAGFAAAIYTVVTGYRRSRTLHDVLDGVFASDPMAHISRGYSETLRALIGAVEARDAYTHGRSARVAELSVSVGLRLGLRPAALRALRLLEAGRGTHFDPRCLDAFLALMAERGHRVGGRVDQAAPADASCH